MILHAKGSLVEIDGAREYDRNVYLVACSL